jgi:predicted 2-oxoglutarate/Fe(II)-dependent dioxygenase YbiX
MKVRQVSASIFLNDDVAGPGREPYDGGAFVFHAADNREDEKGLGWSLQAEEGMFVAFRSDCIHEVQPITRGRRYSIMVWYF